MTKSIFVQARIMPGQKEIDYLLQVYIPQRRDIVIKQLKKKLYPDIEQP
ncbi:MAG: hypothetical protein JXJ04_20035 [Spirochaetales bacterium]|nr:hypothetical protein [Spirochaetales bacterium]